MQKHSAQKPQLKLVTTANRVTVKPAKQTDCPSTFSLFYLMPHPADSFFINVSGNGVEGLCEGDMLLAEYLCVRKPVNGDLVVYGSIDDGMTIGYFCGPHLRDASLPNDNDPGRAVYGVVTTLIRRLPQLRQDA